MAQRTAGVTEEEALIRTFVVKSKRNRLVELLASPKRRIDVTSTLAHFHDLDSRFVVALPSSEHDARAIERELRRRGASESCYVVSENSELDGRCMPLAEALDRVVGAGMGTLVSCVPGALAFFEGEGPSDRCILAAQSNKPLQATSGRTSN
jgi:hypothetical protein